MNLSLYGIGFNVPDVSITFSEKAEKRCGFISKFSFFSIKRNENESVVCILSLENMLITSAALCEWFPDCYIDKLYLFAG